MNKLIIFDCDGTLLDTYDLVYASTIATFDQMFPGYQYSESEIKSFFGPLIYDSFYRYSNDPIFVEQCVSYYRDIYSQLLPQYLKPFKGIKELLNQLKNQGYKLAVLSNAKSTIVNQNLTSMGLANYFDDILGIEEAKIAKPDPSGIKILLNKYRLNQGLLVGDTYYDILSGQNTQQAYPLFKVIGVTWCQTTRDQFLKYQTDYIVDDPDQIIKIVEEYYDL